jgi:hypothetical protein
MSSLAKGSTPVISASLFLTYRHSTLGDTTSLIFSLKINTAHQGEDMSDECLKMDQFGNQSLVRIAARRLKRISAGEFSAEEKSFAVSDRFYGGRPIWPF